MKIKPRQRMVLEFMARQGGAVTAAQFNDVLAGEPRSIRALLASGLVEMDQIPAKLVSLTGAGWEAVHGKIKALAT